jgi:hypothetical protein
LNSQVFTKELRWTHRDSTKTLVFEDKNQILKWSGNQLPFSSVFSKDLAIDECNIYVILVSGCSGIACWRIYIFKEKNNHWEMITETDARLPGKIEVHVDNNNKKIVFNTKSSQIGELQFKDMTLDF